MVSLKGEEKRQVDSHRMKMEWWTLREMAMRKRDRD
jgi:hypothetical protein